MCNGVFAIRKDPAEHNTNARVNVGYKREIFDGAPRLIASLPHLLPTKSSADVFAKPPIGKVYTGNVGKI